MSLQCSVLSTDIHLYQRWDSWLPCPVFYPCWGRTSINFPWGTVPVRLRFHFGNVIYCLFALFLVTGKPTGFYSLYLVPCCYGILLEEVAAPPLARVLCLFLKPLWQWLWNHVENHWRIKQRQSLLNANRRNVSQREKGWPKDAAWQPSMQKALATIPVCHVQEKSIQQQAHNWLNLSQTHQGILCIQGFCNEHLDY